MTYFVLQSGPVYRGIRDSSIETLDRSPYLTIEKPRDASPNCDETAVATVDSTDQSNASPQTSPYHVPINESRLYIK